MTDMADLPHDPKQVGEALYEANKNTWQYRCVEATQQSAKAGEPRSYMILTAAMGKRVGRPMSFNKSCVITSDGHILASYWDPWGRLHMSAYVGTVEDMVSNFRRLADHCKLDDKERAELFKTIRQWVAIDYRAKSELFG